MRHVQLTDNLHDSLSGDDIGRIDEIIDVRDAISRMGETDKTIATMVMQGHTQAEIGAAVGLAQRTIGRRIKRLSSFFSV